MTSDAVQQISDLADLGKYDLAVRKAKNVLSQQPDNVRVHMLLAFSLWRLSKHQAAIQSLHSALSLQPNNAYAHSLLGLILFDQGKWREARPYHERAVSLQPQVALFHIRYAETILAKNWKAAMVAIETAFALDPNDFTAYLVRSKAFRVKGSYAEAEKDALTALQISPSQSISHEYLGDIYSDTNHHEKAFASYRDALRLNPTNKLVKRKIILSLQAKMPVLGFWLRIFSEQLPMRLQLIFVGCMYLGMLISYGVGLMTKEPLWSISWLVVMFLLLLLKSLSNFLISHAIIKGWIKI